MSSSSARRALALEQHAALVHDMSPLGGPRSHGAPSMTRREPGEGVRLPFTSRRRRRLAAGAGDGLLHQRGVSLPVMVGAGAVARTDSIRSLGVNRVRERRFRRRRPRTDARSRARRLPRVTPAYVKRRSSLAPLQRVSMLIKAQTRPHRSGGVTTFAPGRWSWESLAEPCRSVKHFAHQDKGLRVASARRVFAAAVGAEGRTPGPVQGRARPACYHASGSMTHVAPTTR